MTNQFKNIRHQTIKLLNEQPHKFDMSYYTCQEKKKRKKKGVWYEPLHLCKTLQLTPIIFLDAWTEQGYANGKLRPQNTKKFPQHKKKWIKEHTCNVIQNDCHRGIPNIAWNETPEPLLYSCIPIKHFKIWCLICGNE